MRYGFISPVFNALELSLNQLSQGRFSHRGASANFCAQCHGPRAISEGLKVSDRRVSRDFIPLSKTDAELSKTDAELSKTDAEFMGIGCDICHSAPHPQPPSQGLRSTPSTVKVGPNLDPAFNFFHTYALGTRGQEARLWLQSSDFCGSCHDVRPRQPDVERGDEYLRTEDLFTEWERSPWADPQHPQNPMRGQTGIIGVHDGREREGEQVT